MSNDILKATTFIRPNTREEEAIRQLNLKATELKKDNILEAIDCLKCASELMEEVEITYPVSQHVRLPLFMQQAGLMEEAEKEFSRLLARPAFLPAERKLIREKRKLAKEREKKRLAKLKKQLSNKKTKANL